MSANGLMVGVGRADVTGPVCDVGMMGYGISDQRVRGVGTPLSARAYVVDTPANGGRLAFVSSENWGITQALHQGVMDRLARDHAGLGLAEHNVMLTATHTHSGPGGYSHYLLFNLSIPGFVPAVLEALVAGIVSALVQAVDGLQPGHVALQRGEISPEHEVGINRAVKAYNRNADVTRIHLRDAHLAFDREMTTLRFDDASGRPLGAINWFGVHGCNFHADNHEIHPDNKGMASFAFERYATEHLDAPAFVASFPQTTPGDVTPNFQWSRSRGLSVGAAEDDDQESARQNGQIQFEQARSLFESCAASDRLAAELGVAFRYVDFAGLPADADLAHHVEGAQTGSAAIGLTLAVGTGDGPGPLFSFQVIPWFLSRCCAAVHWLRGLVRGRAHVARTTPHGNKVQLLQLGRGQRGKIFGLLRQDRPGVPSVIDPTIARLKALGRRGALGDKPWAPSIMPLQIFRFGALAIVAVPFEPTTVAGRRIVRVVREALAPRGVTHVVVSGYANAYGGYLTTREEYQVQAYEGASNYMGQWTLAATLTQLRQMARALSDERESVVDATEGLRPLRFTEAELALRTSELALTAPNAG